MIHIRQELTSSLRKELDSRTMTEMREVYGPGQVRTTYLEPVGWQTGDGRPELVAETPAHAQSMGRCAANRIRAGNPIGAVIPWLSPAHPEPCRWCEFSLEVLLAALGYAQWQSQAIDFQTEVWWCKGEGAGDKPAQSYVRASNRASEYGNPVWAAFFYSGDESPSDLAFHRERRSTAIAEAGRTEWFEEIE